MLSIRENAFFHQQTNQTILDKDTINNNYNGMPIYIYDLRSIWTNLFRSFYLLRKVKWHTHKREMIWFCDDHWVFALYGMLTKNHSFVVLKYNFIFNCGWIKFDNKFFFFRKFKL